MGNYILEARNYEPYEVDFEQFVVGMYLSMLAQDGVVNHNVERKSPGNCFVVPGFDPFMKFCNFNSMKLSLWLARICHCLSRLGLFTKMLKLKMVIKTGTVN